MDILISNINKLPEVLENKIWEYNHSYNVYKINKKIKDEVSMFNMYMDGSILYELWYQLGLRQLPYHVWHRISPYHNRYNDLVKWKNWSINNM